jgi:hypothetical protein
MADFAAVLVQIEVVGYVCDLKTLETSACISYQCQDEVRLVLVPVLEPESEDEASD